MNCFQYNSFSQEIEYREPPVWDKSIERGKAIDDEDITHLRSYFTTIHNFEPTKYIMAEACFIQSKKFKYHPIKNFIEKEKWDGTQRINEWMIKAFSCNNNKYINMVGAKFLIATVNRVYKPGCKFDHMMILEGAQGMGKSTAIEILADEWYVDTNFANKDKDLIDIMRGALIIEISELSGMNRKDVDWLKSFLTRKADKVRLAYAARAKTFYRNCVFVGTYNPSGDNKYLRDDTGNRRFWPIECRDVDIGYLNENKYQLWAEAYERYKQNERYYIDDPEALEILKSIHQERELEGPTYFEIKKYLEPRKMNKYVTMDEIIEEALGIKIKGKKPQELISTSTIIGIIMKKIGWIKGTNEDRNKYFNPDYRAIKEDINVQDWEE